MYKVINIDESFEDKMVLKALRLKTVPQIWDDLDTHLGGYENLIKWLGEHNEKN